MFSGASTAFGAPPNTQASAVTSRCRAAAGRERGAVERATGSGLRSAEKS